MIALILKVRVHRGFKPLDETIILLIIYFTVRQQNVSTSTQTEIQTASAREEDGFTSGDAEADDGFTSGDIADASDSPEGFSEREAPALCQ